jgi:hypothetical protein
LASQPVKQIVHQNYPLLSQLQDVRKQLYTDEDDRTFFAWIQKERRTVEERLADGAAALQHLEMALVNTACDDPGAAVGAQLALPLLQVRSCCALVLHIRCPAGRSTVSISGNSVALHCGMSCMVYMTHHVPNTCVPKACLRVVWSHTILAHCRTASTSMHWSMRRSEPPRPRPPSSRWMCVLCLLPATTVHSVHLIFEQSHRVAGLPLPG